MYSCEQCGKTYKQQGGFNNHRKKCGVAGTGTVAASDDITKSPFFTIPLTSFKPTANFSKEDLEELERRKQARLKMILQLQKDEENKKAEMEAEAAKAAKTTAKAASGGGAARPLMKPNNATATPAPTMSSRQVVTNNMSNVGNEEHNASFNIKYVKRSEETKEVVQSVVNAANEYCRGRIIVTSDEPAPGGGPLSGINKSVNENGTTVYNHPTRTISIIETPPEDVSPEEEHEITLERMTYLIISLIQNNNKLSKENYILRTIVARIDPACFEDTDDEEDGDDDTDGDGENKGGRGSGSGGGVAGMN